MADVPSAVSVPEDVTENAAELRFPKEFDLNDSPTCKALLNSEVYALLDSRKMRNEAAEDVRWRSLH